jgi:hypothetical protein
LVAVQDKNKLYLLNEKRIPEIVVPSKPFTSNIISLTMVDEVLALVRDNTFMYVVDTMKKKAFRICESPY